MSDQEFVFVWKIQNFSSSFHKNGNNISSPAIEIDGLKKSKWFLNIYPQGQNEKYKGFISIFLCKKRNDASPEELKLGFEVVMIGGDGNILKTSKADNKIFSDILLSKDGKILKANSWGFSPFITVKKIVDLIEDWPEDVLTIRCHMFFKSKQSRDKCETLTEIGVERHSLVWSVRISDISTEILRRDLLVSKDSEFEILLDMLGDAVNIDISSKLEFSMPKSVGCTMSLIDSKGKELISKKARHLFEANVKNDAWEFPVFITKKFLDDNNDNESIRLLCRCVVSNGTVTDTVLGDYCDFDVCSTLQMRFRNMLLDDTYSDIKLKAGNKEFQAHKCVLAVCSPVFSAMFQQDMIESKTNTVDISDVEASILKLFLEFLYTETLEKVEYESAKKLILCADKYQVPSLKEKCASFLVSVLSLENVFEILSLADMIGHERLKYAAIKIVELNSETVINFPEWSLLIESNAQLATQIFSRIVSSKKDAS